MNTQAHSAQVIEEPFEAPHGLDASRLKPSSVGGRSLPRRRFETIFEVVRFGCVGGLGFLTDTAVLLAVLHVAGIPWLAKLAAFIAAVSQNWFINQRWTFRDRGARLRFLPFAAVCATSLVISMGIFLACFHWVFLPPVPSNLIAVTAAFAVNYCGVSRLALRA